MADDKLSEGSEEEKKSMSESTDDDFGLPDLEFDELQELDLSIDDDDDSDVEMSEPIDQPLAGSDDVDMSVLDDLTDPSGDFGLSDIPPGVEDSVIDEGIEEVEDVLDSAQLISDRLGDDSFGEDLLAPIPDTGKEISLDDLMGNDDIESDDLSSISSDSAESIDDLLEAPISGDDLLSNIDTPDDLAALGFADDEADDSSEAPALDDSSDLDFGGDSLFSADEEDSMFSSESSSSFETSASEAAPSEEGKLPDNYKSYSYKESSGGFTKVIVIGVVVIGVIAAGLLFLRNGGDVEEKVIAQTEKKKTTTKKKKPVEKPVETEEKKTEQVTSKNVEEAPKSEPETDLVPVVEPVSTTQAEPGEVILVSERLGASYVIVGSFVDEDLAMDYAKELSDQGSAVKVIAPYGKSKRYRVSIADFSTYGDAASQLDSFKGQFGDQVWALKY